MFSNACRVLSQCNTRLRLLYLLIKTDHSAIILQLHKIEGGVKGPRFWKMNTSILNDAAYIDEVKKNVLIWWFLFVKENITMTLKDIILGLLNRADIINYLIILGKLCTSIWECRKAGIYSDFY